MSKIQCEFSDGGKKWLSSFTRDTIKSTFIALPIITILYVLFSLSQSNFKLVWANLIFLPPLLFFFIPLYYLKFVRRRELFKKLIFRIESDNDLIEVQTVSWIFTSASVYKMDRQEILAKESEKLFMDEKKCILLQHEDREFYFVPELFASQAASSILSKIR